MTDLEDTKIDTRTKRQVEDIDPLISLVSIHWCRSIYERVERRCREHGVAPLKRCVGRGEGRLDYTEKAIRYKYHLDEMPGLYGPKHLV